MFKVENDYQSILYKAVPASMFLAPLDALLVV